MTEFTETPDWVRDAVFYQIFPDRFAASARVPKPGPLEPWETPPTTYGFKGGDLLGIVERLDYLRELGITALYLTPIFSSASNHRYHTYDYYQVDPLLGGDAALRELVDACHARGMRIVLDGVFNHSGRGFWPFHHVVENGADSPYVDWFYVDHDALRAGRWLNPYPDRDAMRTIAEAAGPEQHRRGDTSLAQLGYRAWWDLPALPKLNTNNPGMREHLLGAAEHWLRFGIDGWRLDVPQEIDQEFWREFRARVRAVNPEAYIVGEIWRVKPDWVDGEIFDALMNYPLTEALLSFCGGESLDMRIVANQHEYRDFVRAVDAHAFAARLEQILGAYRPAATAVQLNLLDSHDTPRFLTVAGGDKAALRLATLIQMTLPGAPCIYYGDEVGLEGRQDPDSRRSFPWQAPDAWDRELLGFVRGAVALRHDHPVLRHGSFRTLAASGHGMAYGRFPANAGEAAMIVVVNAGREAADVTIEAPEVARSRARAVTLPGMATPELVAEDADPSLLTVRLAARSGAVVEVYGTR